MSHQIEKERLHRPRLSGTVRAPSSKSEAHRALIATALSALYGGEDLPRQVRCTDLNEDINATVGCLQALGVSITRSGDLFTVCPLRVEDIPRRAALPCRESGSTLRFLLPVACALEAVARREEPFTCDIDRRGRLLERPLSPLREELTAHGAVLSESAPTEPYSLHVSGGITGGEYVIDGSVSSQFISGLLFALPLLREDSRIRVTGRIESEPYIHMTLSALAEVTDAVSGELPCLSIRGRGAGTHTIPYTGASCNVGGDWSGAAFFITAGVLCGDGDAITVTGLDMNSRQGDRAIIDVLRRMGGVMDITDHAVTAHGSRLHGCVIDATQIPDLVPILAVAASVAEGETRIVGAARLRLKESDRLASVTAMLTALGGDITELSDGLIIRGKPALTGGEVNAENDHRIAMSAAVAATRCTGDVTVVGSEAVAKSYTAFWQEFMQLCKS